MRSFRPSGRAMAVAGALALTLVVAGTSGAVAGKLIMSKDIKDGTIKAKDLRDNSVTNAKIAPGAVDWEKSLSDATKQQIESLLGEGVPGPAGPTGPPGPQGATGARGPAGSGDLVFWDYFGFAGDGEPASEFPGYELEPLNGQQIQLDRPGDYLLTMQGVTLSMSEEMGLTGIVAGVPDGEEDFLFNGCLPSGLGIVELPFLKCETTYPVSVQPGQTLDLPVIAFDMGDLSECGEQSECGPALAVAKVAIYRMSDTPTTEPTIPTCEEGCPDVESQLRKLGRQLNLR